MALKQRKEKQQEKKKMIKNIAALTPVGAAVVARVELVKAARNFVKKHHNKK